MNTEIHYISSRSDKAPRTFFEAMLLGLAPDGGLFVPNTLPLISDQTLQTLMQSSDIASLGAILLAPFIPEWSEETLAHCLNDSLNFPIPLIHLKKNIFLLELFHGPTLAFKDVGARFMANLMSKHIQKNKMTLNILVATSGDTGAAVAHAFHGVPDTRVHILYPDGRVSALQEKQMTALGDNIIPLKVSGSFDDCQRLVKEALVDTSLHAETGLHFSTANSINIARLLPQMIYHAFSIIQLKQRFSDITPILSIPSGNLGNLTAAIYAHACGIPIQHCIAAINSNTVFLDYLNSGELFAKSSIHTLSSAMDIGNPSNIERLNVYYGNNINKMSHDISALSITDEETLATMNSIYIHEQYMADPHTAVGIAAAEKFALNHPELKNHPIIVTATAHPAKFPEVVQNALGEGYLPPVPDALNKTLNTTRTGRVISSDYLEFRTLLAKK